MLVFFAIHIIMMTTLHYIFSDAKLYWQKGGFMNFSFFHYMLGNGLANIYIHNWIRMDPLLIKDRKPLQHVATLVRQGCFDLVLVVENVVLLWIALHSEINELKDNRLAFSSVLLGFTLIGLILKWVYYRYVSTIKSPKSWRLLETTFLLSFFRRLLPIFLFSTKVLLLIFSDLVQRSY